MRAPGESLEDEREDGHDALAQHDAGGDEQHVPPVAGRVAAARSAGSSWRRGAAEASEASRAARADDASARAASSSARRRAT